MRKLYRSRRNRMLSGVLGGVAEYFNIDVTIVRLAFIVLLIPSFFTLFLIYVAASVIMPVKEDY